MHGYPRRLAIALMLAGLTAGVAGQRQVAQEIDSAAQSIAEGSRDGATVPQTGERLVAGPVVVPEGNGAPVITDGLFSPGEWDDARRIPLSEAVELRVKQYRGVVFIGVRGLGTSTMIGPSDLFLAVPGGQIHQLHRSAQLGEVVLPPTGAAPPFRFGLTLDWYANEERRDAEEFQRLQKEGKTPFEVIRATSYPSDGIEFAIRRSKFAGRVWLMRLTASVLAGDTPGMLTYPAGTAERTPEGWLELRFK